MITVLCFYSHSVAFYYTYCHRVTLMFSVINEKKYSNGKAVGMLNYWFSFLLLCFDEFLLGLSLPSDVDTES